MARIGYVTIDCLDVAAQMEFWVSALAYEPADGPWTLLRDPAGTGITVYLQQVSEAKTAKNRVHLDLIASDATDERRRLEALGATHVRDVEEGGLTWAVFHDPEGNEFCLFQGE